MDVDKNKPVVESDLMDVIGKEREKSSGTEKGTFPHWLQFRADIKKENEDDAVIKKENGTGVEANGNEVNSLQGKIIQAIEDMFGDYNLLGDGHLKEQVLVDDGWVDLDTLLKYARISKLTKRPPVVIEALKKSTSGVMEVCEETGRIRRSPGKPLPEDAPEKALEIRNRSVYCRGFPRNGMDNNDIWEFFSQYPTVHHPQMRFFENREDQLVFKGSVVATFGTREQAENFMSLDVVKYNDYPIARQWCTDREVEKTAENEERKAWEVFGRGGGTFLKLSGIPDGTDENMIKKALADTPAVVFFVDFSLDHTADVLIHCDAKLVLDKLEDGKVTIGNVSVKVSALEEGRAALTEGQDSGEDSDSSSEEPSAAAGEKSQESPEPGNPAEKARGD